ncbi:hypothetical protein DL96DRAFT_1054744 [Flagelloscypha sp. PMI_526]|nr:hypothetical protein DL96DRAFT_1054744 [Flagelloscypha sp. PMI_526]
MDTSNTNSASLEPLPIRQLSESLVNKIAAGEVIHRPASALKELLENSLDAGSTSIRVTVKDGGLKLLQIQDNGCGIKKEDLPLLCQRFATSKLSTFDDLLSIGTYGFRGEALASMSHVSDLSVITKTRADNCAWKASYADGQLSPAKPGQTVDPKPCAGNDGTTIIISNLFAQFPTRLKAFRSPGEEYARIVDVMTKYAIHNPRVAFVCKKASATSPDLNTTAHASTSGAHPTEENVKLIQQVIKSLYGQAIGQELLEARAGGSSSQIGQKRKRDSVENEDETTSKSWSAEVHFTSANFTAKKMLFIAFVNHRLVDLPKLKRALEAVYTALLPKGASGGFVYASLVLPPETVDVNVHPTKASVGFLDEEIIIEEIADCVQNKLAERGSSSRSFGVQSLLPVAQGRGEPSSSKESQGDHNNEDDGEYVDGQDVQAMDVDVEPTPNEASHKRTYAHNKIRTSTQDRTLDAMFAKPTPSGSSSVQESMYSDVKESECYLTSIKELRGNVKKKKHRETTEILENHTFVGVVDLNRCLSLIQHSTKLYLVNHAVLAEEMFYQLALRQFGNMRRIKLKPAPSLYPLIQLAVATEGEDVEKECGLPRDEIVQHIVNILIERRDMLQEYFSMQISEDGDLQSLPLLLKDYMPNLDKLPYFLMRLGPQVDWTSEHECFDTFLRELAYFYAPGPLPSIGIGAARDLEDEKKEKWIIQHALFPALRRYFIAPKTLLDGDLAQVADLPQLYRIFERC